MTVTRLRIIAEIINDDSLRKIMKHGIFTVVLMSLLLMACNQNEEHMNDNLNLTQEWDKVFPLSEKVNHRKVTFKTQ